MPSTVEGPKFQAKSVKDFKDYPTPTQLQQFIYVRRLLTIILPSIFIFNRRPSRYGGSIIIPTCEYLNRDNGSIHISPRSDLPIPLTYEIAYAKNGRADKIPPERRVEAIIRSYILASSVNTRFEIGTEQETGTLNIAALAEDHNKCHQLGNDLIVGLAFYPLSFDLADWDYPRYKGGQLGFLTLERE